jgi:hypothetical protein
MEWNKFRKLEGQVLWEGVRTTNVVEAKNYIYGVFDLKNYSILDEVVYHECISQI